MKKEVRHWSWFLNILLHMAGLRRQNNSLTLASFAYIHTCLLLCRNVSKRKHSYLSCWLNLHLTKMRPYPASKHYNQGMPISTPGMHCLFGSTLALLARFFACRKQQRVLWPVRASSSQPPSFLLVFLFFLHP
jgi:hypothetical protein